MTKIYNNKNEKNKFDKLFEIEKEYELLFNKNYNKNNDSELDLFVKNNNLNDKKEEEIERFLDKEEFVTNEKIYLNSDYVYYINSDGYIWKRSIEKQKVGTFKKDYIREKVGNEKINLSDDFIYMISNDGRIIKKRCNENKEFFELELEDNEYEGKGIYKLYNNEKFVIDDKHTINERADKFYMATENEPNKWIIIMKIPKEFISKNHIKGLIPNKYGYFVEIIA